jgi:hypothetical protein
VYGDESVGLHKQVSKRMVNQTHRRDRFRCFGGTFCLHLQGLSVYGDESGGLYKQVSRKMVTQTHREKRRNALISDLRLTGDQQSFGYLDTWGSRVSVVVEALSYKPEGRGIASR